MTTAKSLSSRMSSCVFDFNSCAIKSEVTKTLCSALSLYTESNHNSMSDTLSVKINQKQISNGASMLIILINQMHDFNIKHQC